VATQESQAGSHTYSLRGGIAAAALSSAILAFALAILATPARAIVVKIGGHGFGVTPINGVNPASTSAAGRALLQSGVSGAIAPRNRDELPQGGGLLRYNGGPVMHGNTTHVIYWDPTNQFTPVTKGIVNTFLTDVAHDSGLASNVFGVAGQYTDATGNAAYNASFAGPLEDTELYPTSENCTIPPAVPSEVDAGPPYTTCLTDAQLKTELARFIGGEKLPTGPTQLYLLLLPHTVVTCFEEHDEECSNNVFCAYHSYVAPGMSNEIIYADIPFSLLDEGFAKGCQDDGTNPNIQTPNGDRTGTLATTRYADIALKYISHEYIEAITDPLVGAKTAWVDENRLEIGDKCNGVTPDEEEDGIGYDANSFLPTLGGSALSDNLFNQSISTGSYYLQSEWDNGGKACLMRPLSIGGAAFVAPSGTAGSPVSFTGTAVDPYGGLELSWSFGDGVTGAGATLGHTYGAAGNYTVTVTPKDGLTGSTGARFSQTITIAPVPVKSASVTPTPTPTPTPTLTPASLPNSNFIAVSARMNAKTGAITFTESVSDPGTFSWLLTFQNGKFGAFVSGGTKCKTGSIKLGGKCRPARIVFAKGGKTLTAAGSVSFTLKPTASGLKALKNALKQRKGVPVMATLTFQSSLGGSSVSRTQSLMVKLKKK
jgi:PKD domain